MGWKNVKEHFNIAHHIQVKKQTIWTICIGSSWSKDVIVLGLDGRIVQAYEGGPDDSLMLLQSRIQVQLALTPELVRALIEKPDTFTSSIVVYTFKDGVIIEKLCEVVGWPNVTHDGEMMHDNLFTPSPYKALFWARLDVDDKLDYLERLQARKMDEISDLQKDIAHCLVSRRRLDAAYPRGIAQQEPIPPIWLPEVQSERDSKEINKY